MGDSRFPCLSKRFPLYHNFLPQPGVFLHIFQCDRAPLHTSKTQFRRLFSKPWSAAPTGGCPKSDGIWAKFEHQNNAFAKENNKNKGNLRCPEFLVPGCWKKSWKRTTIFFSWPNSTKLLRLKGNCLCNFSAVSTPHSQVLSWNPDATGCSCLPSGLWVTKSATESPKYFLHVLSASSFSLSEQPFRKAGPVGVASFVGTSHPMKRMTNGSSTKHHLTWDLIKYGSTS